MQQIHLKRGLDIPFEGRAELTLGSVNRPEIFHIVPDHFAGITPKLLVREGDSVKAGSPLFHDKAFADMLFTSPVSGKIIAIVRGERRKVMSIDIQADTQIEYENFDLKEDTKTLLLKSGLWALIKQRPYDCIALPSKQPKAIFISTFDSAPAAPNYDWILSGQSALLQTAIDALAKIAPVYVGINGNTNATTFRGLSNCQKFEVFGPHPAGNVSVQINHVAPIAKGETVWTINPQDLAIIGRFFAKGIVDMQKKVALTGQLVIQPQYYNILPGMPMESIFKGNIYKGCNVRHIAGNPLSGHQVNTDEIISVYDNQFTVIYEGDDKHEFMGWIMPRFNDFNAGKTDPAKFINEGILQWLFGKKKYNWDARLKGGRRAIIVSGEYDKVFPMDIYPEYLIKAMIAGNLDNMEQLGAYEVAPEDFALCEYVCTSKMPLQAIVRAALDNLKKEIE